MRIPLIDVLRAEGVAVLQVAIPAHARDNAPDFLIEINGTRFAVEYRQRLPYPNELGQIEQRRALLAEFGTPLIAVPFVPVTAGETLRAAGWSWSDDTGNFDLRAPGTLLRQRLTTAPPRVKSSHLPQGSGSLAIIRALISFRSDETEEPSVSSLAAQAGVSQPRASQVLAKLNQLELVRRVGHGRWQPDREALLDRFLKDYRGPGGTERYFYSLDPLSDVAVTLAASPSQEKDQRNRSVVVSADVGPDLISAWRRPTTLIVYVKSDLAVAGTDELVSAQGRADANVIIRSPRDGSMFPTPTLVVEVKGSHVSLADPTQMIWDLHDLGGQDRIEAAGVMRSWLLSR